MINLHPGDVFGSRNPQNLGRAICLAQAAKSQDQKAEYSHTGIITCSDGTTVEAVWKIASQNIYGAYSGQKVIVARYRCMNVSNFFKGYDAIKGQIGRTYPYLRLILHAAGLARWIHIFKVPVCSELTALFLIAAGAITTAGDHPWGITPDDLVDEWRISKYFDIIFEGVLP